MTTTIEAVDTYECTLADLENAYAAMERTFRTITDTVACLHSWPRANTDLLIDALPLDWPDAQRLVTVLASYGRAWETALQVWSALSPSLQEGVTAPNQFLLLAKGRTLSSRGDHRAETMPGTCP